SLGNNRELEEERRLAYVGITRARQRLYLSRAVTRGAWGQPQYNPASRFLDELPESLLRWERTAAAYTSWSGSGARGRRSGWVRRQLAQSGTAGPAARGRRGRPHHRERVAEGGGTQPGAGRP